MIRMYRSVINANQSKDCIKNIKICNTYTNTKMSKRNKSSSGTAGLIGVLGVAIGAGLGFLVSKLLDSEPERKKEQQKVPVVVQKQQKGQFTKTDIDSYDDLEELMICPITHEIMEQPCVLTTCGHSFEKKFIYDWIENKGTCPLCLAKTSSSEIQVNYQLKELIHYYQRNKNNPKKESDFKNNN